MMSTARYGQHQKASEEQRVTEKDHNSGADQASDEVTVETTSVFRADFLNELDAPAAAGTEGAVSGVEGLPVGSALLVVKRGPNAGSRFLLDQPTTSAGRHPDSDIFLDDVTVSRRHAEFRLENAEFQVVDVGSLNGTYVNREPVDSAVLANGDEIQIGKFRLVFLTAPRPNEDAAGEPVRRADVRADRCGGQCGSPGTGQGEDHRDQSSGGDDLADEMPGGDAVLGGDLEHSPIEHAVGQDRTDGRCSRCPRSISPRSPRRSHDVGELNLGQPKVPDYLSRPGGSVAISPLVASWSATSRSLRFRR